MIGRAEKAMAVAWGAAMTLERQSGPLPYIPILSALGARDFVLLVNTMIKQEVREGEVIVAQHSAGDALYIIAEGEVEVVGEKDSLGIESSISFFSVNSTDTPASSSMKASRSWG